MEETQEVAIVRGSSSQTAQDEAEMEGIFIKLSWFIVQWGVLESYGYVAEHKNVYLRT